ncbi:D-sedoheptulose-7-phosphate isomerase [Candidatus Thiosymbion oneisti]|uniref:D-sedoheptulose-7-phosphate isomerase n=1 Tax=Candidatus Thiosymbion oneisti TaxID=589554 RepID=UPI00105B2BBC|nr:SIS domain-containing protein [Candidatus Thiosymbion oneisti]
MQPSVLLQNNLQASINAKQQLLKDSTQLGVFETAVKAVAERYQKGGRLYIAGNGGSAADAQHLAAEFVVKLARDRVPLPAEALTVNTSILTAIGNDYGHEHLFARQVTGKMTEKDIFLGITTSGQSGNILKALDACREKGIPSIVFTGRDGGRASEKADYCILAPGATTSTIQEVHIVLAHTLCEYVERIIFQP